MDGVWLLIAGVSLLIFFLLVLVVGIGLILYVRKKRRAAAMAAPAPVPQTQPGAEPSFASTPLAPGHDLYGSPPQYGSAPMSFTPEPPPAYPPEPHAAAQSWTPSFAPEPMAQHQAPQSFTPEPKPHAPASFSEPFAPPASYSEPAPPPSSFHQPVAAPFQEPPPPPPVFAEPAPPVYEPPPIVHELAPPQPIAHPPQPPAHAPLEPAHAPQHQAPSHATAARRQGWGSIVGTSGAAVGRTIPIDEKGFYIGRDRATAQVVIENARISKRHVWIGVKGGAVVAVDQSSTNGTYLNKLGTRITEVTLQAGDTIILADDAARFQYQP